MRRCRGWQARITARACSLAWARRAPHDVPLLFVSGAEDPVGDNGRGVRAAAELARRAGQRHVDVRIYEGMRHEMRDAIHREAQYYSVGATVKRCLRLLLRRG